MPPKVLYFDLGMVLVEFSHERMYRQMADVAGVSADVVREAILGSESARSALLRYETGHMTTDEFFDYFARATGSRPDRERLAAAVCDIFAPIAPMWALVRRLAAAGQTLAILSNTNPLQWKFITDGRFPVLALGRPACAFQWGIVSYEVHAMKPDRAIYEAAIARAGVAAHEVFFTDDRLENVAGALAVGIDAVPFVDSNQLVHELRERGVRGV